MALPSPRELPQRLIPAGRPDPPAALRYGVAAAATGAALAVTLLFPQLVSNTVFIFFFAAIVVSAWYGGMGPALVSTLLSVVLATWLVLPGEGGFPASAAAWLRVGLFVAVAVLIGGMRARLAASRLAAEAATRESLSYAESLEEQAGELELQAAEMQEQAAELELQTEEARRLNVELEEANRLLKESTARQLAEAQALAHVGSWEWLVREDRVEWSDEMYRIYGLDPGPPVTLESFLARVHPDDRGALRVAVERAVETGEPFDADHRILRPDGSVRLLHARGRVERGPDGQVERMVGTGQDVTETRAAEETARRLAGERAARATAEEGRRSLESILEGIGESFLAVDAGWRCTYVNRRAEETIEKPRAELLGRSVWDVFPQLVGTPVWSEAHRVRDDGVPRAIEYQLPETGRWFAIRFARWNGGISVFYADVTGRRRAQEERARLAAIVDSSTDAIFAKSLDGTILTWNAAAERLYGYTAEEIVGRPVSTLAPPDRADEIPGIMERLAAGERIDAYETVRRRKDGTLLDVLLSISPLHDADGRIAAASTIARDITGRKRTEAALRASEARYRRIVETAEEGIWILGTDGATSYVNERTAAMLGRPAAEVVGRPFTDFVHPEGREEVARRLARRRDGAPERLDVRLRRADGGDLWALVSLSAVAGETGAWGGTLAMVTDVTDRRRAEESLRFVAEAGRTLAQSLDRQTVMREIAQLVVPGLADYAVVVLDEPGGGPGSIFTAHRDREKLPLVRAAMERHRASPEPDGFLATARRTRRTLLVEEVSDEGLAEAIRDPDTLALARRVGPRSLLVVPLTVEERPIGVMMLAISESARRYGPADAELAEELARRAATAVENARLHAAEREARHAAERSAELIARLQAVTAALSEAGTAEEVAEAALQQAMQTLGASAGWVAQLDASRGTVDLLVAEGYPRAVMERFGSLPLDAETALTDAVREGRVICIESREELERRYPHVGDAGQRGRFGAWAVAPLGVEGRAVGGLVLNFPEARAFDDDTRAYLLAAGRQSALALERARLYEAERRARAEAESANRAKFDFLTTMSHELRTPLNAIAGYVDLLEMGIRGPLTPEQRGDLARIRRSQTHLLGLINDVLNFARIETGHVHFDLRDVRADEVLAEVEPLIAPQVQARGVTYAYTACDPALALRADPEKLRQIVLNLLSNAVKFTGAGGRIALTCDGRDGMVHIRVQDTGIGIPEDKLGTIFEPFVQVNAGYTRTSEGTGLGLSISRDLARAMGGELTVESTPGAGSVFTLSLPAADGAA